MHQRVCYIAGPYRSKSGGINGIAENIARARAEALRWWQAGFAVICPHMNTAFMDGACTDETWLQGDLEIMRRCDIVVMMPGFADSAGATAEYVEACRLGMTIAAGGSLPEYFMEYFGGSTGGNAV